MPSNWCRIDQRSPDQILIPSGIFSAKLYIYIYLHVYIYQTIYISCCCLFEFPLQTLAVLWTCCYASYCWVCMTVHNLIVCPTYLFQCLIAWSVVVWKIRSSSVFFITRLTRMDTMLSAHCMVGPATFITAAIECSLHHHPGGCILIAVGYVEMWLST